MEKKEKGVYLNVRVTAAEKAQVNRAVAAASLARDGDLVLNVSDFVRDAVQREAQRVLAKFRDSEKALSFG